MSTRAAPGLQVGSGEPIDPAILRELRELGVTIIRIDLQQNDLPQTAALAQQVIDAGLQPLCIIRRPEQMVVLPEGALVEVGNEPDLAHFGWTVESYRKTAEACVQIALERQQRLYVGVVSNLNPRGFAFLRRLPWASWPSDICCSVHRYPEGHSPLNAHRPAQSRDEEIATLRSIVGNRPLAVTEVGYHDGPGGWTEAEVAEHLTWERRFFSEQGFEIISAYGINDGTGTQPIDHYGFRRLDGTWKPVAYSFPKATESSPETPSPAPLSGIATTLLSVNGFFVCAEGGGGREVVVDREQPNVWEEWHVHTNANGTVSLQASNGWFLTAGNDGYTVLATAPAIHEWEQFTIEVRDDLIVSFKTFHGTYLQAVDGGGPFSRLIQVSDDPTLPGEYEFFQSSAKFWTRVTNRPLVGPLRVHDKMFRDDSGWRRVLGYSWFPALRVLRDDPAEHDRQLDAAAAANFQVERFFLSVGGWTGWLGSEVAPRSYTSWVWTGNFMRTDQYGPDVAAWPDYNEVLRRHLRALRARKLRAIVTTGDMQITCPNAQDELDLHRRFARICAEEGGTEVLAQVSCTNEFPINRYGSDSQASIDQMGRILEVWRAAIPGLLTAQGAIPQDEEPASLLRASQYGDVCVVHPTRSPFPFTMKRTFGLTYYEGNYRGFAKPFEAEEPWGPEMGVTPYPMNDPEQITALYALHGLLGHASMLFQGSAVLGRSPLDAAWAFRELPTLLAHYLPEDVAQWAHGHDAAAGGMEYWWQGNDFRTSVSPDWNPAPPRPIARWTLLPSGRTGTGTPPIGLTGLLVGSFQ